MSWDWMGRRHRAALWPAAAVAAGVVTLLLGGAVARAETTITSGTCDQSHLQAALDTGGTITFSDDCTIDLTSPLRLTTGVTIDGSSNTVVLDGGNSMRIFEDDVGTFDTNSYALVNLTMQNGNAGTQAGGVLRLGFNSTLTITGCHFTSNAGVLAGALETANSTLSVADSTFTGNASTDIGGGAIYSTDLTVTDSTFVGNAGGQGSTSSGSGGAIYHAGGTLTLTGDTFSGNTSGQFGEGGAVYDHSSTATTITTSTFVGNTAFSQGGGAVYAETTQSELITNSTFSSNTADSGGAVYFNTGVTLANDTIANSGGGAALNGSGPFAISYTLFSGNGTDCNSNPAATDNGYNLTDTDGSSCGFSGGNHDTVSTPAHLADLGDYGGPTQTMALQATSPAAARDTVSDCGLSTDQRGVSRPTGHCSIGAAQFDAGNQSIGTCDEATLDSAVAAGIAAGTSTIDFGCSGTITLTSPITVQDGTNITLDGNGHAVTVDGGGAVNLFLLRGASLTLDGLRLADAYSSEEGAVVDATSGSSQLTIADSLVEDNFAVVGVIDTLGTATITNSTFDDNTSDQNGVVLTASGSGSGTFSNDTFVNNTDTESFATDAAITTDTGTITLKNNVFKGNGNVNSTGDVTNCSTAGTVVDDGYNLADADGGCGFVNGNNHDVIAADPGLTAIGVHGGPTNTYALFGDSPALDTGSCTDTNGATVSTDQRGDPRPAGNGCDIGAYEAAVSPSTALQLDPASPDGSNGWYVTQPQATLAVTDPNGGATATTRFSFDTCTPANTGGCSTYSSPFAIPDGDKHLAFFTTDSAPAWEAEQQAEIKVDDTAPATQADSGAYTPDTWTASGVDISLSATDNTGGSGVASTSYTLDGGAPVTYSAPFTVSGDGVHTLDLSSTDNAGNVESGNAIHVDIAGNGMGSIDTTTTHVAATSTANTVTLTFTAPAVGLHDGAVSVDVPDNWSAPSTTSSDAGYTTASSGTVGVSGQTITVSGLDLAGGDPLTIVYGDTSDHAPGATAAGDLGAADWTTKERSAGDGTLTALASSPSIDVVAADGSGTLDTTADLVSASSAGHTVSFTYTAAAGGTHGGVVKLDVPDGWSAPSTIGTDAGYTTASAGTVQVSGQTITVSALDLAGGDTVTIVYGDASGNGAGASASDATGAQTWQAREASLDGDAPASLAVSPSITVVSADGSGTLGTTTEAVSANGAHRTLRFTYTAATGGMHDGQVQLTVPAGWSAPDVTASAPGYTSSSTGTVGVSGRTITVSGVTLSAGATLSIVYGDKGSSTGPGATAPGTTGDQNWNAAEGSLAADSPAGLAAAPSILVAAPDGSGVLHTSTTAVSAASQKQTITFTYTAATGGLHDGAVRFNVPSGWSAPSSTPSAAGYTTASGGTVGASGQTVTVSGVTLAAGDTLTVVYGDKSGGGAGATASAAVGGQTWSAKESSSVGGVSTALAGSAHIRVYAADGSGALTPAALTVAASSQHHTLTFTYTAALGGMSGGVVRVVVPSGWSAPSRTASAPGYTTSSVGIAAVSGQTIAVSGVALSGGQKLSIVYGSKASGGPGATAPASTGAAAWQASEASLAADGAANLANSPAVQVVAADGSGTFTDAPAAVSASATGRTMRFTYTAATGGIVGGKLTLTVPSGWSPPSTVSSDAGYTTANVGSLAVSGRKITVSGVTRTSGQTVTLVYGSRASQGPGAGAPAAPVTQTWPAAEASTAADTPASIATLPVIVAAPDGSGTVQQLSSGLSVAVSSHASLAFFYTADNGGLVGGSVSLTVPSDWSPPSTNLTDPGYTFVDRGNVAVAANTITVTGLTLAGGQQFQIDYGSRMGGGPGAVAPSTGGTETWTMRESSSASTPRRALASSPKVDVVAPDGSGTMDLSPAARTFGTTGQSLTFTYTTANGGMSFGILTVAVPSGWPAPSMTRSSPGYTTTSTGFIQTSGRTIEVTGLHRTPGETVTIVYGSRASGGPGVTIPNTNGPQTWTVQEASGESSSLTSLATQPAFGGVAPDGSGAAGAVPSSVQHGSKGQPIGIQYACASGGMFDGTLTLAVPAGWSAPSTSHTAAGYTVSSVGTVSVSGRTITVSGISCASGDAILIAYGSRAGGGPGPAAPLTAVGNQVWTMTQRSSAGGTLTSLATSPSVKIT